MVINLQRVENNKNINDTIEELCEVIQSNFIKNNTIRLQLENKFTVVFDPSDMVDNDVVIHKHVIGALIKELFTYYGVNTWL